MNNISRRDFLRFCGIGAAAMGLSVSDLGRLEKVLANPNGPSVIWLQGSGCTGCSESFLNRISTTAPKTAAGVLIDSVNLVYHPTLMSLAGQSAAEQAEAAYNKGGFILAVEGGIPTAYSGHACEAWTYNNEEVTFQTAVQQLSAKASKIICIGTCASWGGISAAPPNPTGVKGVKALTGKTTVNIAGCPPHPDWIVWAIAQLLLGNNIKLDSYGRPSTLFSQKIHDKCPRKENEEAKTYGVDALCLKELGCRGPEIKATCPTQLWNNKVNWCIDANSPCIGCTEPKFPGSNPFHKEL
jgi:hydrogenase small subunit